MQNSIADRQNFEIAIGLFQKAFSKPGRSLSKEDVIKDFRPTQSRLRLEQPFTTTSTKINFPVVTNVQGQAAPFITETRLNPQDSFVPTRLGIYVALPSSGTPSGDAAFKLLTYLNPFVFAQAAAMQVFYNSTLSITIGNDTLLPAWSVGWHERRPNTQQTAAAGAGSPVDEFDGDEYGLRAMNPFVLLVGTSNLQVNINFPAAPSAIDANSRIVLVYDGLLFQNSTVLN
jgi:hypothetical protein